MCELIKKVIFPKSIDRIFFFT